MTDALLPDPPVAARRYLRLLWVGILVAYVAIFAIGFDKVGLEDHDQHLVFHEIQSWNQELFGLDRQWTPVMGGGMNAAGDPQIPVLSPAALAGYVLGPFWGMRLVSFLWFVVGFFAAYLYAGLWLRRREARALAGALFIGNGFFVCHYSYGHIPFLPFMAFPLLLWMLHKAGPWARAVEGSRRAMRRVVAALSMGALIAIQVDGAAQVLVYLLPWVGIYALGLAIVRRSFSAVGLYVGAVAVASVLGAAFLWSLIDSQQHITQRLRPGQFTNPVALFLFMLVPFRGMFPQIPTPQNGYELSVFAGVIVVFAILRYGRSLLRSMPRDVRTPLLITAVLSVVFGTGSLVAEGLPQWMSPYDWLRELPGFRSIVVTGRFWGFLALPLSLLGAAGLWRLASAIRKPPLLAAVMLTAIGLQIGFQSGTLGSKLLKSRTYEPVPTAGLYDEPEKVSYVRIGEKDFQGKTITPTTGVINAFNLIDFIRPGMQEGDRLVARAVTVDAVHDGSDDGDRLHGYFESWSQIRLSVALFFETHVAAPSDLPVRVVLNQAWHPYWRTPHGKLEQHENGNLVVATTLGQANAGPIVLDFHDEVSALGTRVSLIAWPIALVLMLLLGAFALRTPSSVAHEIDKHE